MNIVDPILFHCRWQPTALALCAPGTLFNQVTYGRLEQFIHNVGRHAREHGIDRSHVVALFIRDPVLHVAFILGLTKLGVVTVSSRELDLPKELHVDFTLVDSSYPTDSGRRVTVVDKSWLAGDNARPRETAKASIPEDEPCRILLTSGTTGSPKAVIRNSKHIFTRIHGLQTVYGSRLPNCSSIYLDMGLSTGIGFTFLIYTLSKGGALFMRGGKAADTIEALSSYKVQAMIAAPNSLSEMADLGDETSVFYSGFDVIISSGSMMTKALSERVRARLSSNLVAAYGSTEAGVTAAAPSNAIAKIEGAVGYIVPGVTVDIVGQSGEALPAGREGLVRIRSECLVDGYIGDPEGTRLKFRDEGFYPGDVGLMTPNGMLVIAGRQQTVINLGGDKVSPERIEAALTSFAPIRDAAAFATATSGGSQVLNCAIVWNGEADESGLREHLRQRLPSGFIPTTFIGVETIPRNSSGKIDRGQLKRIAAQQGS